MTAPSSPPGSSGSGSAPPVAAYVAKYVSKSVGDCGGVDYRIHDADSIRLAPVNAHLRALMTACWRLGALPELDGHNLGAWVHALGYRDHVLTKSRQYSTTYGVLR
ncbi:replication initiator [Streptomyces canus]|uniref:replication initiator n=1 Tax=Streptomyces canus TaxID=58343 RepID=UPI0033FAE0E5